MNGEEKQVDVQDVGREHWNQVRPSIINAGFYLST